MKLWRIFQHRHRSYFKELYAPWEGDWKWMYRCACGYEWSEPAGKNPREET